MILNHFRRGFLRRLFNDFFTIPSRFNMIQLITMNSYCSIRYSFPCFSSVGLRAKREQN